ncbi:hypothetical protein SAMN05428942_7300 [Streptomyces sp. 2112.2]|uniref:hypothetical protein n=1 Tax=Streptomyces sp. 2112.2 TaxID=1881024 RepID=UPI000898F8AE|nr:hypothetical protein [Streptomyces sp. 2112.2]SEF16570.1 hypothetical protein SAMN05428942_7300 [Streptomyces sp. 2112.2]
MTEIPEEAEAEALRIQAAALRAVREVGEPRAELLARADEMLVNDVKPAVIRALLAGAERGRVRREAHIGSRLLYQWMEEAGIPVRVKKPSK